MRLINFFTLLCLLTLSAQARADTFAESFIRGVLASHPSILGADAERQAADEDATAAWRQMLPELQVTTSNSADRAAQVLQPKRTMAVEQKLWAGGKFSASIDAANVNKDVASYKYEEARITLALSAVEALQSYRASTERIRVIDEVLKRLNRFVQLMDRRVIAEVSPPVDASLVRSRLVQAQVDRSNAVALRNLSISRLEQLNLGSEPVDWQTLDIKKLEDVDAPELPYALGQSADDIQQVVATYPSVRRYEAEAQVALHRQRALEADQYPVLYARMERNHYDPASSLAAQDGVTRAYVGIRFTPGAGLASMSLANASALRAQVAVQQADTVKRELTNQIRQDWEEQQSAKNRLSDYRSAIKNAETVSDSYERQFIVGRLSWQQTLDAVRELGQVGISLADTEASLWAVNYKLKIRQGLFNFQDEMKP